VPTGSNDQHIAVIDLMSLATSCCRATWRGGGAEESLFGLTDDDLFKVAWQRKGSCDPALARVRGRWP
jgi:ATP-dependent helicase/nuclease subunit A